MKKTDFGIFLENFDKRGSIFRGDYKKKEIFLITEIKKANLEEVIITQMLSIIMSYGEKLCIKRFN